MGEGCRECSRDEDQDGAVGGHVSARETIIRERVPPSCVSLSVHVLLMSAADNHISIMTGMIFTVETDLDHCLSSLKCRYSAANVKFLRSIPMCCDC